MATPNLIQPAQVSVLPLDKAATKYNSRTRAPVKVLKRSTSQTFQAQVQYFSAPRTSVGGGGLIPIMTGYLIARKADLDALGYAPSLGDKVSDIGSQSGLSLYLTNIEKTAWSRGEYSLFVLHFSCRHPTRGGP